MQLIVVFMHNIPSGHEQTMKPVGPNNTDPGCWQYFSQRCLAIVDMTFDELSFQWGIVNQQAVTGLCKTISRLPSKVVSSSAATSVHGPLQFAILGKKGNDAGAKAYTK